MGTNTLTDRVSGQTILDTFFNDTHSALNGDLVGRSSGGVATAGQNLGTNAIPFGSGYITSLILNGSAVDASLLTAPKNRIVSGKTRSASNQPQFIDPNGGAASFVLEGATTNLVIDVDGVAVQVTTDITKSSLTVGPSTTATCLVDDTDAADQEETKTWGEYKADKETITVDNMGAEFQTFIGQWVIIQIAGVATEYALAFIKSTTEITNVYRGFFTNSSSAPVNRTGFTNNDVITVLSTGWVFVENDGATVDVSYVNPVRSFTSPSGSATGDYWYDLSNETWKRFDGATFQIINRTLVGVVGIDSANCVAARSFDFFAKYEETNNAEVEIQTTSIAQLKEQDAKVNVYGNEFNFGFNHETWNITSDLAGSADMYNATEQASTLYYMYLKDTGETVISDISPYYRPDLLGSYHPHNPWRCVGEFFNSSGSDIIMIDELRYNLNIKEKIVHIRDVKANTTNGGGSSTSYITRDLNTIDGNSEIIDLASDQFLRMPGRYITEAITMGYDGTNLIKGKLLNVTDTVETLGDTSRSSASGVVSKSFIKDDSSYSEVKQFEIQMKASTASASTGLGIAAAFGDNEIYTQVKLIKRRW